MSRKQEGAKEAQNASGTRVSGSGEQAGLAWGRNDASGSVQKKLLELMDRSGHRIKRRKCPPMRRCWSPADRWRAVWGNSGRMSILENGGCGILPEACRHTDGTCKKETRGITVLLEQEAQNAFEERKHAAKTLR